MSYPSTLPAVKAAFVQALQDDPGLASPIQVTYGLAQDVAQQAVAVGSATMNEQWATFGASGREESYDLDVFVGRFVPGDTQQQATEGAFSLFARAEKVVRVAGTVDGLFGVAGVVSVEMMPTKVTEGPLGSGEGFGCEIEATVRVRARI